MKSRMDKYNNDNVVPSRTNKNKELYRQIYNAYDNFENLIVPSNAREIELSDLKNEITIRTEYHKNKVDDTNNIVKRKEKVMLEQKAANDVYDINELLNKAVNKDKNKESSPKNDGISNEYYLNKLNLDKRKTNFAKMKEKFKTIREESLKEEDESLIKTANLSLEILSDLKSDNDETEINAPIKDEELPNKYEEHSFYSNEYKFEDSDFEDKENEFTIETNNSKYRFFLKVLLTVFLITLFLLGVIFVVKYFNKA